VYRAFGRIKRFGKQIFLETGLGIRDATALSSEEGSLTHWLSIPLERIYPAEQSEAYVVL
jgi:hypothetical protein